MNCLLTFELETYGRGPRILTLLQDSVGDFVFIVANELNDAVNHHLGSVR